MQAALARFNFWALGLGLLLLLAWQGAAARAHSPTFPAPLDVLLAWSENLPTIVAALGITLRRAATAFCAVVVVMVPLGILVGRVRWLGFFAEPAIEFLNTIPPPAIVPLVMLFAGTGDLAKIAVVFYSAAPFVLINTLEGVKGVHPMFGRSARSLGLSRLEAMALVDLPAALPTIFTGLRLSVSTSLLVSITAEMLLATDGIGTFLQRSQESFQIAAGLAGIASISLLGAALNFAMRLAEKRALFWHYRIGPRRG